MNREAGATLVETAAVFTLLFLLVMGIIDFGRYVAQTSAITTASRESARYGSAVGQSPNAVPRFVDCAEIRAVVERLDLTLDIVSADIAVSYDSGPGTSVFTTCPVGGPNPDPSLIDDGDRIVVTVTKPFTFVSPLIDEFFGPVTITSTDRRTIQSP